VIKPISEQLKLMFLASSAVDARGCQAETGEVGTPHYDGGAQGRLKFACIVQDQYICSPAINLCAQCLKLGNQIVW
jgi:hypothetical protein